MKKVLIALFTFLLANNLVAQSSNEIVGIKGGFNYATITKGDFSEGADPRASYYLGFFGEVPIINRIFSIQPELIYSRQGFEVNYTNLLGNNYKEEYRIDYINVPILAKVHIGKVFAIEGGPQFGFKINEKIKNDNNSSPVNEVNSFDTALAGGISLGFEDFLISGRYTYSLNEVIENSNAKNSVFQIGVGFVF